MMVLILKLVFQNNNTIENINKKFTSLLGEMIKKYPSQYFWFHKIKNKRDYK